MASADSQNTALSPNQLPAIAGTDVRGQEENVMLTPEVKFDIEHAEVHDDPRKWSKARKYVIVAMISAASMIAGLGSNIYNPAISQIEKDLHATSSQLSLTLSLFILIQGGLPLFWSAISEIRGRKTVYLTSIALCMLGCIVSATAKTINVLIGMRCLQAAGSSAVMAIGAATLADLYEPAERGTVMGIYYCAPLLGPSLGPILGGVLTQAFNWRATFWFLAIFTGLCTVSFVFFQDTFRRQRSLTYQSVLRRVMEQEAKKLNAKREDSIDCDDVRTKVDPTEKDTDEKGLPPSNTSVIEQDMEAQHSSRDKAAPPVKEIKLSLTDINPVKPIVHVLSRLNNVATLVASGLLFAFNYSISYTASRTLENQYGYDALQTGLVLLAYGIGCLLGSVLGGRYSDYVLSRVKARHGGKSYPEMRLQSTLFPMVFFPPAVVAYGWVCEEHVSVAAVCVMLFLAGFFQICIYTSTLAYIVDANAGRSSSAVASNSFFRGVFAFIATEIAVPLQDSIGDGGLYSFWGGLVLISQLLIILVWWKGGDWREKAAAREARRSGMS
ncbi:MFS general substrate transporter [Laetiporus sulphureus 93-53]|uniref:MFS general substrate transporter n=1 Tax=Laetiporus sulphureus 93-53 TaxID=1314785 RepID=A0A165HT55_9APHY|nr:MFS general substrate transporter [Laetiporus sulphureus 93-53]KZT12154.1 MFS general substrate transporter [Laetiporus sulphureus 93-53]